MKHGIVGRETEGYFRYRAWPSVCMDEDGVLYAACSGHRVAHVGPFGKDLMFVSRDGGETWSAPQIVNDTYMDDRDAGIVSLGGGKLLLSWFNLQPEFYWRNEAEFTKGAHPILMKAMYDQWRALPREDLKSGSFVRLSKDYGKSWSEAIRVPVTTPHGPIQLKNGKLLYIGKAYDGDVFRDEMPIQVWESSDDGQTWSFLSDIALPEGVENKNFYEPHAVELPNGRILGAIRAQGANVANGFTIYLCHSDDCGHTWSIPRSTDYSGSPPHMLLHSSGAVIMTYGRRQSPIYGQRVRVSYDGGETWSAETELTNHAPGDHGYPATVELPNGSLLTVYYQRYENDPHCSILYTKWELSELQK